MPRTDEVIILAGGFGTRLRSVVSDVPKPMAPVRGRPFVTWLLDALAAQHMRRVVLATGYMGERVAAELGTGWRGMTLTYLREERPLGTGGAIAQAMPVIQGDSVLVLNGDTWLALDYAQFDQHTQDTGASLGMALARVPDAARYGAVSVGDGWVEGFVEKGKAGPGYINAGVYWLDRRLLGDFPSTAQFSFESEVLVPTAAQGRVSAYLRTNDFIDIGIPEDYARAAQVLPAVEDAS